ncbi:tRNA pseudouridine(55) synthase TruB, partial [Acinetobacter baumannii]|uniref:tRNA pseudouridine(55) synthase TruB n=1 Tax=Acinetobacter baumannii TaxID=470 RepID=UPI00294AE078
MQRMQKKIWWCVLGFFILSLIACVYWLSPDSENTSPQPNQDERCLGLAEITDKKRLVPKRILNL